MKKGGNNYCRFFVFIIFVFILNLTLVRQVFCYDTNIAHPGIAGLAVKLYNQNNAQKITAEQFNWIKTGAIEEDEPTRWLNHFYDPVYNRGLWFVNQHDSAKVWAKNPGGQKEFSRGDNSWQRAVNDYRKGNFELAFKGLGHNVHLVSDMLIPAHTRDSIHAVPPDSYENYVKNNWDKVSKDVKGEVFNKNSLEDIFDEAAKYSNGNFYSDKTIESNKYNILEINKRDLLQTKSGNNYFGNYTNDVNNSQYLLYIDEGELNWRNKLSNIDNNKKSLDPIKDGIVLSSYTSHLLPKAIGYSANTIKLFLAETQKNEKEKVPFFRVGFGGILNNGVGKIISVAENIYNSAQSQTLTDQLTSGQNNDSIPVDNNNNIETTEDIKNVPVIKTPVISNKTIAIIPPQDQTPPITPPLVQPPTNPTILYSTPTTIAKNYSSGGGSSNQAAAPIVEQIIVETTVPTSAISTTSTEIVATSTPIVETTTTTTDLATTTIDVVSTPTSTTTTIDISTSTIETTTSTLITTTTVEVSTSTTSATTTTTTTTPVTPYPTAEPLPPAPDVVINEIAWAGTSAGTSEDEYIELYNNTDQDINLFPANNTSHWWKLMIGDKEVTTVKTINRIIPKNGYYLFERTDDRTVNEISADTIYYTAMKNSGERLRLLDGNNQLVDEVENTAGWFAGSSASYSSMEKINSLISGNTSTNWQTNIGPRWEGKVDGGGDGTPLNGSPKQSNFGSIVLKSRQDDAVRTIKKSDFPYILTYYEIPVGKTLNIDPGVIIKAAYTDSKIDAKGNLNVNGTTDDKVIMTSGRDINFATELNKTIYGSRSGSLQSKDWQGLMLYASSTINLTGLEMRYAGKAFKAPGSNTYDPFVSQAIRSEGATLNISNSIFNDNGDSNIYSTKSNLVIKNTNFKNGLLAVENMDGNLELENVGLSNFTNINGPVYVKNIWPKMSQINFSNNTNNNIAIDQAVIATDLTVNKDIPLTWQNITIQPGVTVNVSAGTSIKMPEYSNITVKGVLNLNGTEDEPISISPIQQLTNYYWGRIIFDGGNGDFKNVNISGGRGSVWNDPFEGTIVVNNGGLDVQNSQLLGGKAPGNIMEINNSTVGINNSSIGYIGTKPAFENTNGIKMNSGSLMLNNTNLMNLDTGIFYHGLDILPDLYFNNMDTRNFMNVKTFWDPILWLPAFATDTPSAI